MFTTLTGEDLYSLPISLRMEVLRRDQQTQACGIVRRQLHSLFHIAMLSLAVLTTKRAKSSASTREMSFLRFQDLPAEIRLVIWKESLEQRTVQMNSHAQYLPPKPPNRPIPSIIHINAEARHFALGHYKIENTTEATRFYFSSELDEVELVGVGATDRGSWWKMVGEFNESIVGG